MDFEDIPSPMAFPVPKRGKRTLVGLALSLFIVATYWYFPSRWFKVDNLNTPRYVDNDWDRLDEVCNCLTGGWPHGVRLLIATLTLYNHLE